MGYRFRIHVSGLPGRPDIVLPRWKQVIFVHGCFWHRHQHCKFAYTPKSRLRFWLRKFDENVRRDLLCKKYLRRAGWRVAVVWECETAKPERLTARLQRLIRSVNRRVIT